MRAAAKTEVPAGEGLSGRLHRLIERDENRMPERTRRLDQAGEKRGDDAPLPGKAEIVELNDRRGAARAA